MKTVQFYKKVVTVAVLFIFSGCSFLARNQEVITEEEFKQMVQGEFENTKDIVNVFPKSAQDVDARVELIISSAQQGLDNIIKIKAEDRTFENTIRALDKTENQFGIVSSAIHMFEMLSPDEDIRNACHEAAIKLNEFAVDAFMNVALYQAFKDYLDGQSKTEKLNAEERYYLEEAMKEYHRNGFDLPKEEFEKVKELKKEISNLALEFDKNINTDQSKMTVTKEELAGLEDDFIESLEKEDGKYVLKCDYPIYFEVMENCKVESTRKDLYFMFMNRAYPANIEILNSVIAKRDKLAKMLNFDSYAHLDLDSEMTKKPKRAYDFLTSLLEKTTKKWDKEFEQLTKELPKGVSVDENGDIAPWSISYLKSEYKKKHFDVDERAIAKYFPVENTVNKIFEIYQKFLELEFKEIEDAQLWNKDIKLIKIYKKDSNKFMGHLFLDLYPRANKYPHACMSDIVPTIKYENKQNGEIIEVPAVIIVVANFPKPTKEKPALLKHNDVETFFHEFGHAMHGLLGKTEMAGFSGTSVKRDFVEMPSQMLEEWMWDKEMLKLASKHYQTGEPLPDELIDKKVALKKFDSGYFVTRQCWLALLALDYFAPGKYKDTQKIKKDLHDKYISHVTFQNDEHFQANFGHLMGYGAKYYGYMWAKVFALDMFYKIKEVGLLNSKIGRKLIDDVLGRGGSVEPDVLLKEFLGREPNQEAFLKDLGIVD